MSRPRPDYASPVQVSRACDRLNARDPRRSTRLPNAAETRFEQQPPRCDHAAATPRRRAGPMSRRGFLKALGVGAGAGAVVAGGGLVWRALDQSVFAPGSGPAYGPWRADLHAAPPYSLVSAAILAANAHNTQPWFFAVSPE